MAPQAAGVIHTDLEMIYRAEVIDFRTTLVGGETGAKEKADVPRRKDYVSTTASCNLDSRTSG